MNGRTRVSDWGRPVSGRPVRLALLTLALPVAFFCMLGVLFNWPRACGPNGCGDPEFAGSAVATGFYGVALTVCITGGIVFAAGRVRTGGALLVLATALTAWGIFS